MVIYSEFSHEKNVIFHSYVSLPNGIEYRIYESFDTLLQPAFSGFQSLSPEIH